MAVTVEALERVYVFNRPCTIQDVRSCLEENGAVVFVENNTYLEHYLYFTCAGSNITRIARVNNPHLGSFEFVKMFFPWAEANGLVSLGGS